MEIKDLTGLSEPLKKLIEVVSQGVGALSKPYLIRKTADAKAYEIKLLAQAIRDNQQDLNQIIINEEKLSVLSLNSTTIQNEIPIEERTQKRIEFKEQKRQKNIENITQKAAESLEQESTISDEPVDEDWISRFFDYAEDISNEEMQELWSRILAGEIKKPKSYSLRTLDILRNISKDEAKVFLKFAKLSIFSNGESFILNFKKEKLLKEKYQLNYKDRLLLEELGLIASNDLQYKLMPTTQKKQNVVFIVGNYVVLFEKNENRLLQNLHVLVFTKIGQELLALTNFSPDLDYIQLFATKMNRENGNIKYASIIERFPNGDVKHIGLTDVPLTKAEKEQEAKRNEEGKSKN